MEQPITSLFDFIAAAQKSRNYTDDTAAGMRTAMRLFEKELKNEESASIPLFKEHLMQIYRQVVNKNISNYTAGSLEQYKKRILRLLGDYEKYGVDQTKMASWIPRIREMRKLNKPAQNQPQQNENAQEYLLGQNQNMVAMTKFLLTRPQGMAATIQTAHDLTIDEATKIRAYIDYLMVTIDPNYKPGQ